ncbi:MAG: right-handed parallel beta-helix repeat-containing protein, partial [Planctomycetota bacterium]
MRLVIFLAAWLVLISGLSLAVTVYVPDNYPTIQAAIDASSNGDTIIVRSGTYVENIDFVGKAIVVTSEDGPALTVIDGNQSGSVVVFINDEEADSVLQGFTITNGSAVNGGGVRCENSGPTLHDDLIISNFASQGGGMHNQNADPRLKNCTLSGNSSGTSAGGIYNNNSWP